MNNNSFNNDIAMATYVEQIVSVKKTGSVIATCTAIWFLAAIIIFLLLTFFFSSLTLLLCFGIGYGAFWLTSKFNVEFEYIITNGTVDIDKITNKSSRKRIMSFELKGTTRLEKYNPAAILGINKKEILTACDINGNDVYFLSAENGNKGNINLIFSPNKKVQKEICKFAPKFLTNNVFE